MNTKNGLLAAALLGLASTAAVAAPVEPMTDETEGGNAGISDVDHAHSLFVAETPAEAAAAALVASLPENVNHASAVGNPFEHPMVTSLAGADDATADMTAHASATGNPLAHQVPTTLASIDDAGANLSNHASAGGGFGTGALGTATAASGTTTKAG